MNDHLQTKTGFMTAMQYILVIDNELVNRTRLTEVMKKSEHEVVFARDTVNALRLLTEMKPVMIIIGFTPGKPDRRTFTRILKNDENTAGIRVVALSEDDSLLAGLMPIGFDGFINIHERGQDIAGDVKEILLNTI
jgi:CheY-like chemotaxis protein